MVPDPHINERHFMSSTQAAVVLGASGSAGNAPLSSSELRIVLCAFCASRAFLGSCRGRCAGAKHKPKISNGRSAMESS